MMANRKRNRRMNVGASREQDEDVASREEIVEFGGVVFEHSVDSGGHAPEPRMSVCFDGAISMPATRAMPERRGRSMTFRRRSVAPSSYAVGPATVRISSTEL